MELTMSNHLAANLEDLLLIFILHIETDLRLFYISVYNWTTEDVVCWLVKHVELPIYVESFKSNSVSGPTLPRLVKPR